ncbi:MAG: NADP-dependent isocitrate dehydrogenase, partial [Gammaproteobacteria bacterium]|nr:NADP-dependent isocitrate dehydrogenase [Gammaproteobacteria bacterium]
MPTSKIIYTETDEAPALATYSFLPIVQAYAKAAGVEVETRDISLAGRIIANFPDKLSEDQKQSDALTELGELAKTPEANIIKLPNISASIPQLHGAIKELQALGYDIPDFPEDPANDEEASIKLRYAKVLGSAVNPVLREGNSDRRVADPVKEYAQKHPHSMGEWSADSKSHVASMSDGDFYSSEQSVVLNADDDVKITFTSDASETTVLKASTPVLAGEVIDATRLSKNALCAFFEEAMQDAKAQGVLLSLHMKATMMKISDPIIFGHAVNVYYKEVFAKHAATFEKLGVDT